PRPHPSHKPLRDLRSGGGVMDEHEVASQVLAAVDNAAYRNSATRIPTVHLAIGGRRVLDLNRLQTAFAVVARGTVVESAQLSVKVWPGPQRCRNCGNNLEASPAETSCPACGHP